MINNFNIANHGSLTKGQFLKSNNYVYWKNIFGSTDRCFKFWSLKDDVCSFEEQLISLNGHQPPKVKYCFNDDKIFTKQEFIVGGGFKTEIYFDNFQVLNSQVVTTKKYDLNNELKSIESHKYQFNRIFEVRYIDMGNNEEKINHIDFRRFNELSDFVWLLEDDKQSEKIKFYFDEDGKRINKTIEFKNSSFDKWKKTRLFNENGQILKHIRNAINKDDRNQYWETKDYSYDSNDNLIKAQLKFNNGEKDRMQTEKYTYDNQQLKEFSLHSENGSKLVSMNFNYDKIGNPIEILAELGKDKFEYEYDSKGNWIKMKRIHEGKNNKNTFQHNYTRTYEYK